MNTARLSGCECSTHGAYEPTRAARLWQSARPALWGLFAGTLICGAAVLVEVVR